MLNPRLASYPTPQGHDGTPITRSAVDVMSSLAFGPAGDAPDAVLACIEPSRIAGDVGD